MGICQSRWQEGRGSHSRLCHGGSPEPHLQENVRFHQQETVICGPFGTRTGWGEVCCSKSGWKGPVETACCKPCSLDFLLWQWGAIEGCRARMGLLQRSTVGIFICLG